MEIKKELLVGTQNEQIDYLDPDPGSQTPVDKNKDTDSAENLVNPPPEDKADEEAVDTGDVAVTQALNPVGSIGDEPPGNPPVSVPPSEPPAGDAENANTTPGKKGKRGRPPGSRNKAVKKKPAAKKPAGGETKNGSTPEDAKPLVSPTPLIPPAGETQPILQWFDRDQLVRAEPFSNLLPINPETYESIKASMLTSGFDPTHPVHVWDRDGSFILVDGYTRDKAAGEADIRRLLAFIHRFQDEPEALEFAIWCQMNRRNLTGGEMFLLGVAYDEKVKPGSTQERQEDGTFAPRASTDATGKSAAKTAEKLHTTATNIERIRYLHRYADTETKAKVTDNKLTLSRACEVVRKQLAARPPKKTSGKQADAKNNDPVPLGLTPDSDVAYAVWQPVVCHRAGPPVDIEVQTDGKAADEYVLAEDVLALPDDWKKRSAQEARRVLVLPGLDLFADEVPVKTVRAVLQTAAAAKRYNFLFTTKNPARLTEFSWEENTFAGVSIFGQKDVDPAEDALRDMDALGKWLVVEQLTMELTFQHLDQLDWLVVRQGAGGLGAALNPHAMKSLLRQAWEADCPVLFERGVAYRPTDAPKKAALAVDNKEESNDTHE